MSDLTTLAAGLLGGLLGAGSAIAAQVVAMRWDRKKEIGRRIIEDRVRTLQPLRAAVANYLAAMRLHGATQAVRSGGDGSGDEFSTRLNELNIARYMVRDAETTRLAGELAESLREIIGRGITAVRRGEGDIGPVMLGLLDQYAVDIERRRITLLSRVEYLLEGHDI